MRKFSESTGHRDTEGNWINGGPLGWINDTDDQRKNGGLQRDALRSSPFL